MCLSKLAQDISATPAAGRERSIPRPSRGTSTCGASSASTGAEKGLTARRARRRAEGRTRCCGMGSTSEKTLAVLLEVSLSGLQQGNYLLRLDGVRRGARLTGDVGLAILAKQLLQLRPPQ